MISGYLVVDKDGWLVPSNSKDGELDRVAYVQTAPTTSSDLLVLQSSFVAMEALKSVKADPKFKRLTPAVREAVEDFLAGVE